MSNTPPRFSLVPIVAAAAAAMVLLSAAATRAGDQHINMKTVSPEKGAIVSGEIRWEVQAVDGTPSRVDFQMDGEPISWSERIDPYVFNGDAGTFDTHLLSDGQHTLTATAYSADGKPSETKVRVTVANSAAASARPDPEPLSVSTSIVEGANLSGSVAWTATPTSAVSEVQFLIDGAKKWVERVSPYQYNGDPSGVLDTTELSDGSHTLTATAIASDGTSTSATRSVTIRNVAAPPQQVPSSTLQVETTVTEGATLSGSVVWTATPTSAVSEVQFLIDGAKKWVERVIPYQYNGDPSGVLNTTMLSDGSHTLTATAVAADGTTVSATRSVTVRNVVPAVSTLSAGSGSVYFSGDWETGNTSQWTWGAQCVNYGTPSDYITRGSLNLVSDVVGQGSIAGRFDLPASSQNNACEGLRKRTLNLGADEYYGMMFRLPTNWQEPSPAGWGLVLAQLNYQLIWGAPVMIAAHANHVSLVTQTGYCSDVNASRPGCRYSSGPGGNLPQMQAISSLSPGSWHELVIHVRWAADSSGVIEVWHRLKGGSGWTKTVSFTGYPTVQWSDGQSVDPNQTTSDKFGAYRGAANFPLSVWQDGVAIGTSFDAVAGKLP